MIKKINDYFKSDAEKKLNMMKASETLKTKKIVNKVNLVLSKIDNAKKNVLVSLYNSYRKEMDKDSKL
ncbi:MAG: hypothetical protein BWY78_00263 [Alphaproteobacteria bacterium ADurb.Bin438]|nr:MAG: hypothetical protein BWY78_00263 [Alphaproteobacteria bacterium ADurb.Bin438]